MQRSFDKANALHYAQTDWALDISEGEFLDADIRGVPASDINTASFNSINWIIELILNSSSSSVIEIIFCEGFLFWLNSFSRKLKRIPARVTASSFARETVSEKGSGTTTVISNGRIETVKSHP